jgi:hypothetical protein
VQPAGAGWSPILGFAELRRQEGRLWGHAGAPTLLRHRVVPAAGRPRSGDAFRLPVTAIP